MADITPTQVHDLLTGTHEFIVSTNAASEARDMLGRLFLDVARTAKVGLRDLSAVSGLHHATIRAMIQRAIGPGLPDGFVQPELPIWADLADGSPSLPTRETISRRALSVPDASHTTSRRTPVMSL